MIPYFDCEKLLTDLIRDEGIRLKPYLDTAGKETIGIGRNLTERGITFDEAKMLAKNDIAICAEELDQHIPWWRGLSPARQQALMNMMFNMGWPRLSGFVKLLDALRRGDWETAKREALDSKWADESDGKRDGKDGFRAVRVAAMFEEG
jgi:lysozyme